MGPERLRAMERWNLFFGGIAIAVAAIFFPPPVLWGVAVGTLLCCANFYAIRRIWESLLSGDTAKKQGMQMLFVLKTLALIVLCFLAIRFLPISAGAFAVGISIFLLSIAVESARFVCAGHASQQKS